MLIDADADWCWLMLIDVEWCWLMWHYSPSPIRHHLFTIMYSPPPIHHHLFTITYSPSPIHHHIFTITYSPSRIHHHLFNILSLDHMRVKRAMQWCPTFFFAMVWWLTKSERGRATVSDFWSGKKYRQCGWTWHLAHQSDADDDENVYKYDFGTITCGGERIIGLSYG